MNSYSPALIGSINSSTSGSVPRPIYLDHHATTPVDPRVAEVVLRAMTETFGNANSVDHVFGENAAMLVENARQSVADLVGADAESVRFVSGATEGIRLAFSHAIERQAGQALHVALMRVEHKAVLDAVEYGERKGYLVPHWLEVDASARLSLESLKAVLEKNIDLVCLMAANNEVGTLYPVREVADLVHAANASILVDATQAAGRIELHVTDWSLDYLVFSAHKLYGPKGVGALVVSRAFPIEEFSDLIFGREGTANVPGIAGFGEACRIFNTERKDDELRITRLRDRLQEMLAQGVPDLVVNGDTDQRLSHNLHIAVPHVPNEAVAARLHRTVAISTGSACSSGAQTPSHVLQAMGLPTCLQEGALRIGVGRFNTDEEIHRAAVAIVAAIQSVKATLAGSAA